MQVAFFGGSFDPPHVGHVLAAAYVLSTGQVAKVVCVPVFSHAFAKPLTDFEQRVTMTRRAMQPLPAVEVSEIEREQPAPNYTLHTLRALRAQHPDWQLRLMVGSDVFAEQQKWKDFEEVVKLAPPLVLARAGVPGTTDAVLPQVSSSQVRSLLQQGGPDSARLATLVPHEVLEHITAHGLYR
jgi:nicotinate-nucleotide adenylyltransferase